jgi:hypothetical protein
MLLHGATTMPEHCSASSCGSAPYNSRGLEDPLAGDLTPTESYNNQKNNGEEKRKVHI